MPPPASSATASSSVDALILCALQDELEGVLAIGGVDAWEERKDQGGFRVYRRTFDNGRGGKLRVAAAWAGEMGRVAAVSRAQQLVRELDPVCLAMCGICAGDRRRVGLGDVIVADQLYSYDEGKVQAPEGKPAVMWHSLRTFDLEATWKMDAAFLARELDTSSLAAGRPRSRRAQRGWLLRVLLEHEDAGGVAPGGHPDRKVRCPDWADVVREAERAGLVSRKAGKLFLTAEGKEEALNEQLLYPDGLPEDPPFKVHVGALGTGAAVQEDRELFDRLRRVVRTTYGIDMEGAAIGEVAARFERRMLVVKAVSDFADEEKDDSFRGFGCRASAEVLMAFLLEHLEPGERPADIKALMAFVGVLVDDVESGFEQEHARASALFMDCQYAQAREAYLLMLERAQPMAEHASGTERTRLLGWVEQCKLNVAFTTLNLQELDKARALLLDVQPDVLPIHGRLMLVKALALIGERERAHTIVPADAEVPEEDRRWLSEARQILELAAGRVPEDLVDSADVHIRAATVLLAQGNLAAATEESAFACKLSPGNRFISALAVQVLVEALRRTIYEIPPCKIGIPVERRGGVVDVLDAYFADAAERDWLSAHMAKTMRAIESTYRNFTDEPEWIEPIETATGTNAYDPSEAFRLVNAEQVDDALRALPLDPDNHPWRSRFDRVQILAVGKQLEAALDESLALARDFPDRAPIEHIAAKIYALLGRSADAVKHSEVAYTLLPAKGYRLLLADLYMVNNRAEDAWQLLEDREGEFLRRRAVAAQETGRWEEAERSWRRHIDYKPEDAGARVDYARLLYRLHRISEAASVAWRAYDEQGTKLDVEELYACGWLQKMADPLVTSQTRRRVLDIAGRMDAASGQDGDAASMRRHLLSMVGEETPSAAISTDVVERALFINQVDQLSGRGLVPIHTAADIGNFPLCHVVLSMVERTQEPRGVLCPPTSLDDTRPTPDLAGTKILVSDLELVLLEALDIMEPLHGALGAGGQLMILRGPEDRLHQDLSDLRGLVDRSRLAQTEELFRSLEHLPEVPVGANAIAITDHPASDEPHISPTALFRHLHARGAIDAGQYTVFVGNDAAPTPPLPPNIAIKRDVANRLFRWSALPAAFDELRGSLFLHAEVKPHFRAQREHLMSLARATELAGRVHERLAKIHKVPRRPEALTLPPLKEPKQPHAEELFRAPLEEVFEHRRAMVENQDWWRLSAELYDGMAFGMPEIVLQVAWPSDESYRKTVVPLRDTATRDITLPTLVRLLRLEPKDAERRLRKLAEMGFPDALTSAEILDLVRQFGDLDGAEPRRLLDAQERMARQSGHKGGSMARRRIAYTYGQTIFNAFLAKDFTEAQRKAVLSTLLRRQEIISEQSMDNALDQALATLASGTAQHWQRAWKPHESGGSVLDLEGPIARMWRAVRAWTGTVGPRRAALGRAFAEIWRTVSAQPGGPPVAITSALEMARVHGEDPDQEATLGPELDAILILSALWNEKPFDEAYSDILREGTDSLTREFELFGGGYVHFTGDDGEPVLIAAPAEALLLRARSEIRQEAALRIRAYQGQYDGICYRLLEDIQKSPEDVDALRAYAAHASTALFRFVQADPAFLRVWGQAQRVGIPDDRHRFDELRDILSEPPPPLPAKPLSVILAERVQEDGYWANRDDGVRLFVIASEVPGTVPILTVQAWLEDEQYEQQVENSLYALDHSDEFPIAQIATHIFFLRVASTHRPLVRLPEGEVDLREILPARLESLLKRVMGRPEPDTYASTEAPLLRVCGEVIVRLAYPAIAPFREGLWLTWRLFQWLCLQLDAISPDARRDGIRRLVAKAPPLQVRRDILDPFDFDHNEPGRFDHRLAAVLHALGAMEAMVVTFKRQRDAAETIEPRRVSSPALEDKLIDLAQRVHVGARVTSVLDWNAPDNVPDLALNALFHLSKSRFAELSPEARTRRFNALPDDPQTLQQTNPSAFHFANQLIIATTDIAPILTPQERTLLEAKLRAMTDGPIARSWRWGTFVSLFAAGAHHLEDEARALTAEHITHTLAPYAFGRLLLGVAARDPARVEPTVDAIIAAATDHGPDVIVPLVAGALGRLLVHGVPEGRKVAAALLLQLAERPPFRDDPRMNEVIGFFGLREARR